MLTYPGSDFMFMVCPVTPRKSDATVSTREQTRLHGCWWLWVVFSRSRSLGLLTAFEISCRIWWTSIRKSTWRYDTIR